MRYFLGLQTEVLANYGTGGARLEQVIYCGDPFVFVFYVNRFTVFSPRFVFNKNGAKLGLFSFFRFFA